MRVAQAIEICHARIYRTLQRWSRGQKRTGEVGAARQDRVAGPPQARLNKDIAFELNTGMKTVCLWALTDLRNLDWQASEKDAAGRTARDQPGGNRRENYSQDDH